MPEYPYPCLQCGRPSWGIDKYIVCDRCLGELEDDGDLLSAFEAERRTWGPTPLSIPLSPDERRERLRELLDTW
jgi:hypothetical protein